MKTQVVEWENRSVAIEALKQGEVVLFPTETVYGIACRAEEEYYHLLRDSKDRPAEKPFTLMCSQIEQVVSRCKVNAGISDVLQELMPGELTVLLKSRPMTPHCVDLGTGVTGVRIPNSKEVLSFIDELGEPLLVSSANLSGQKPALDFESALATFDGRVSVIIKGSCVSSIPSTVVDLTGDEPKLIRQGSLPFEKIAKIYKKPAKTISLGSDHGGFAYKNAIAEHLKKQGYNVLDFGTNSEASCDYPIFGKAAAKSVASGESDFGIVVCTSGEGISIAANKVAGVRCGIGYDDGVSVKLREHNNANMIAFGQKYMKLEDVLRRVDLFLSTPFSVEAKHHRRVDLLEEKC